MRGLLAVLLAGRLAFSADAAPRVEDVEPFRDGGLLGCVVRTSDLPGAEIHSSLESGLPSAVEMALEVLDDRDRVVGRNRVSFRIAFDLWEEIFRVEGPGDPEHFADLAELETFLETLPSLPVAPISALDASKRHRIRVGMRLHPIAPRETERLGAWVAGEPGEDARRVTDDPDGREVSVSLGALIRFFYQGARKDEETQEGLSPWFVPAELEAREGNDGAD